MKFDFDISDDEAQLLFLVGGAVLLICFLSRRGGDDDGGRRRKTKAPQAPTRAMQIPTVHIDGELHNRVRSLVFKHKPAVGTNNVSVPEPELVPEFN